MEEKDENEIKYSLNGVVCRLYFQSKDRQTPPPPLLKKKVTSKD